MVVKRGKPVCKVSDIPTESLKQFDIDGTAVCVINAGKHFYACQARCPHEGIALCEGAYDDGVLTCLEHLWQWNLVAGGKAEGLAEKDLQMFSVSVEGGMVYVGAAKK